MTNKILMAGATRFLGSIKLKRGNKDLKIKELPYAFKKRMFGHKKGNLIAFLFSYLFTFIKLVSIFRLIYI